MCLHRRRPFCRRRSVRLSPTRRATEVVGYLRYVLIIYVARSHVKVFSMLFLN